MTGPDGAAENLAPDDPRLGWDGICGFEARGGLLLPLRLPQERVATTLSANFARLARLPVGARFAVRTDADRLLLELAAEPGDGPLDVLVDGRLAHRWRPAGGGTGRLAVALPGKPADVEVWLPQLSRTWLGPVGFHGHRLLEPARRDGARWVAYGSSLTHAMYPHGPSESWASLVARRHGWRLRNLGFAGEAYLDPLVARVVRDTPAELVTLEIGTNAYLRGAFTARSWGPAVCGFVETIRDAQPDAEIAVVAALPSVEREQTVNAAGLTLAGIRELTGDAVRVLQGLGDTRLHLIDGRQVLPLAEAEEVYVDGLHPTPAGEHRLAGQIGPILRSLLDG
ncbi:GDSL-type esterase/lipase family protein [Kitasatospora sp. SUK 42]|uniref:GDSL-type esterase/lipase family protein n=1 Tax=Kitasatospora sp. SUK 42 TaxID=1588882 RepID=UPI0027E31908|nr:GDSL-type esterase/lipase family protein [Kitasatospora sp. SUK 42]